MNLPTGETATYDVMIGNNNRAVIARGWWGNLLAILPLAEKDEGTCAPPHQYARYHDVIRIIFAASSATFESVL